MATTLADHCIYTIAHKDLLADAERKGEPFTLEQAKSWRTGLELYQRSRDDGASMPVLFGDATDCSQLLHWGLLTKLVVGEGETSLTVDRLRRLPREHTPQELVLCSSGKHIAPRFIRPYAICLTPAFIG